ncbi:hypothetical protein ILYODFUR_037588 [Ilyodon furcidens]|uniref:Secreted protein n=1 Tax=Ilyodon furcidens TaxID=33524 RepID=A0ABV0TQI4_9TELE
MEAYISVVSPIFMKTLICIVPCFCVVTCTCAHTSVSVETSVCVNTMGQLFLKARFNSIVRSANRVQRFYCFLQFFDFEGKIKVTVELLLIFESCSSTIDFASFALFSAFFSTCLSRN